MVTAPLVQLRLTLTLAVLWSVKSLYTVKLSVPLPGAASMVPNRRIFVEDLNDLIMQEKPRTI